MFQRMRSISLAAAVLGLAGSAARGEVLGNRTIPVKTFLVSGCGNVADPIDLTGTAHFLATRQENGNRTSLILHQQFNMEGMDTLGNRYSVMDNTNTVTNVSTDSLRQPYTITINFFLRAVGQGGAPNFSLMMKQHVTVNPDGSVAASFSDFGAKCQ